MGKYNKDIIVIKLIYVIVLWIAKTIYLLSKNETIIIFV